MGRHKKKFKSRSANYNYPDQHSGGFTREPFHRLPISEQASGSHANDNIQNRDNVDKNDIPGFYFDPETSSYFRITSENRKYFEQKKTKNQGRKSSHNVQDVKLSGRNRKYHFKTGGSLTSEIVHREYQNLPSSVFESHILCARLKIMKQVNRNRFSNEELVPEHCQTMVGNPACGSVIGAWTTPIGTVVYNHRINAALEENSSLQEESPIIGIHFQHVMTDMCIARVKDGLEFVLYVGNPARPTPDTSNMSTMHLFAVRQLCDLSTPENTLCVDSMTLNMEQNDSALWSCAWNQNTQGMAFGSEGSALLITLCHSPNYCEANLPLPRENVFSLEFNKSGNLLYCGVNKGNLKCFDLRTQKLASNIKLTRGLSYMKLLSTEEHIIASCYDHKLVQVDLRAQKVVVEYSGHNNEHMKLPLSVSEKNDFLCSVGQDKCTRIWNLKHGNIVSSILPSHSDDSFHPYAWFSEDWELGSSSTESALVLNVGPEFITYKP